MKKLTLLLILLSLKSILYGQGFCDTCQIQFSRILDTNKTWLTFEIINNPEPGIAQEQRLSKCWLETENDTVFYMFSKRIRGHHYNYNQWMDHLSYSGPTILLSDSLTEDIENKLIFDHGNILYSFQGTNSTSQAIHENLIIDTVTTDTLLNGLAINTYHYLDNNNSNLDSSFYYIDHMGFYGSFVEPYNLGSNVSQPRTECFYYKQELLWQNNKAVDFNYGGLDNMGPGGSNNVLHWFYTDCYGYIPEYIPVLSSQYSIQTKVNFSIYPNPTSSTLNISAEIKFQSYKIVDMQGKVLDSGKLNNGSIDVSALRQGLHYLVVETKEGIVSKKFTKI